MTDILFMFIFFTDLAFIPLVGGWIPVFCGNKQKDVPNEYFPSRLNRSLNLDQSFSLKVGQHTENIKNRALFNLKKILCTS